MNEHEPAESWEELLPRTRGTLPNGRPMPRTDPSGSLPAKIMFLGVYPAATEVKRIVVGGTPMMLPMAVEETSFAPTSRSGRQLDDNYLAPVGLSRANVFISDIVPYFFGNTTKSRSGRSMADNLRLFEERTGNRTGIDPRPAPAELVRCAHTMPGNLERLRQYIGWCSPKLLFTLGIEAAAFARGEEYVAVAARVDERFYADPIRAEIAGHVVSVVHLVHPHLFIKRNARWIGRHRAWCSQRGRLLAAEAIGEHPSS